MITKNIYLLNPYVDVIKVNAVYDSVFRLHINKAIVYNPEEIIEKIAVVPFINQWEDNISRIIRWLSCRFNNNSYPFKFVPVVNNVVIAQNSRYDFDCGSISQNIYFITNDSIENELIASGDINGGHVYNGGEFIYDNINKVQLYKGRYLPTTLEEVTSDFRQMVEPLRMVSGSHHSMINYTSYVTNSRYFNEQENTDYLVNNTNDDFYMKLPGGSSFVFPVKSENVPVNAQNEEINTYANLIVTIPTGITGTVEMPMALMQITGSGVVSVNGVQYTLPAEESVLKAKLQHGETNLNGVLYYTFTVISNSGGLLAEYMLNYSEIKLYHNNVVDYDIVSGGISFERIKTETPIPTHILSVNKNENAKWTLDYDTFFSKNKSFKIPIQDLDWADKIVYFLPNSIGDKYSKPIIYKNYIDDTLTAINAGDMGFDECFASILNPKDLTFTTSLELSFTSVDGSETYYTLDGTIPGDTKTLYTAPFTISATTTVKWINIKPDYVNSHVNTRIISTL